MLDSKVRQAIKESVLCWLATSNIDNQPNVSPKEMFTWHGNNTVIIANIASPEFIENIKANSLVCVSFINIFVQKGYKIKGVARIVNSGDKDYSEKKNTLTSLYTDQFPIKSIIEVLVKEVSEIIAPSYFLYKDITEQAQVKNSMKNYNVTPN